jgi:very-short-patch-repair endonuclease
MWNNMSDIEKNEFLKKLSNAQQVLMDKNPEQYRKNKSNAARCSHIKQFKNNKMNKIEQKINEELKNRNIEMTYSVIFCYKQFDFGNKDYKILLEVQGDYWHGNPSIYGPGLRPLNEIQTNKIKQDKDKEEMATKYGFKLFKIWESDINNNNFIILDEIGKICNKE